MKRLYFPALLVIASLVFAVIFTTVTAVTLASYAKDSKTNTLANGQQVSEADHATVQR